MTGAAAVLAHQGGWDEILFVLVPIALFAGLLAIANQRASRAQATRDAELDDELDDELGRDLPDDG